MKSLIGAVLITASLAVSVPVLAQSNSGLTRAQVLAELVQLEQVGYHPGEGDQVHYPEAIQAAEARVAARNGDPSGYGGGAAGSSQDRRPAVSATDWNAMYSH